MGQAKSCRNRSTKFTALGAVEKTGGIRHRKVAGSNPVPATSFKPPESLSIPGAFSSVEMGVARPEGSSEGSIHRARCRALPVLPDSVVTPGKPGASRERLYPG